MGQRATTITEFSSKIAFFYNEKKLITIHRNPFDFIDSFNFQFHQVEDLLLFLIHKMLNTYQPPLNLPAQGGVCRAARGERERMHMGMSVALHAANEYCRWSVLTYFEVSGGGRARLGGRCGSVWPQPTMSV
jgi:hypothetical protein